MKTGYLIEVYMDFNPNSPSYGETMEVRLYNTEECPTQGEAQWTEIYRYCEMLTTGAYTGYEITVLQDVNPDSATYGQTMQERNLNQTVCPPDSTAPDWRLVGDGFCEQTAYMPSGKLGNNGYFVEEYMDYNEYSPTYHVIEQQRAYDLEHCPLPDTNPTWIIISETCHTIDDGQGHQVFDGTKDVVRYDANEYSASYNFGVPETINVRDTELCPVSSDYPIWTEQSYTCVLDENGYRTGAIIITEMDTNNLSPTYGQTRTRTVTGDPRCPVETPQDALTISWKIINNRSGSTDLIQGIDVEFNDGLTISTGGGIPPLGGWRDGVAQIPYSKRNTQFVVQSISLTPNTSAPVGYTWTQYPNPYIQASQPNTTVVITLVDDAGSNPVWVEQSRTCELDAQNNNTGYAIVTELDTNPNSSSYNTTRTRRVRDTELCPVDTTPNWEFVSSECQKINGFNTGKLVTTEIDTNPYSNTYNQTRMTVEDDLEDCPITTDANWVLQSRTCEKNSQDKNTGYVIDVEIDNNPNSETYGQTRTNRYQDTSICQIEPESTVTLKWKVINDRPSTTDTITRFFATCNDGLTLDLNGNIAPGTTVRASQPMYRSWIDTPFTITNVTVTPNSSNPTTYGWLQEPVPFTWSDSQGSDVLTIRLYDSSQAYWVEQDWYCEQQDGFNSGRTVIVEKDYNPTSQTYNTTRTRYVSDDERCVRDTHAAWTVVSWECEQDGPSTDPVWVETSRTCNQEGGYNTGYATVVETDTNPNSATYNTTRTSVVEDLVNCPLPTPPTPTNYKLSYTLNDSTTGTIECDQTGSITATETYNADRAHFVTATVGDCVTSIGTRAFQDCTYMTSIKISSSVTDIGDIAFNRCSNLAEVHIDDLAAWCGISYYADASNPLFYANHLYLNGNEIVDLVIPNTVTVINNLAFAHDIGLRSLVIPDSVITIGSSAFFSCTGLTSVTIGNSVESILPSAFSGCSNLTSITIPSSVTSIGTTALLNCTSLTSITCLATTPPTLSANAFNNTNNCPIYVPASSVNTYKNATRWSSYASRIQAIPNS